MVGTRVREAVSATTGLTPRVGLADFPRDALSSATLIEQAREALRHAREAGLYVVDRASLRYGR